MTLDDLEKELSDNPNAAWIHLTYLDWEVILNDPKARPHIVDNGRKGWTYQGVRLLVVSPGPSRVTD